jgi:hypothetical protein
MKYAALRPFADPAKAARKLIEIANATEAVQDGRIHVEKINSRFLFKEDGSPAEYTAGLDYAIAQGLALEAPVRRLCEVHPSGRGPVRLTRDAAICCSLIST